MNTNPNSIESQKNPNDISGVQMSIDDQYNPALRSPNTEFECTFYSTRDTFMDVDEYKNFIQNCIHRFRTSESYKNYKHYLYDLGLNRCQLLGNIEADDKVSIEMHHNFLNIFDITLLITEHHLNTIGYVSTFDIVQELKECHRNNMVPIVMLSKTAHQLFHQNEEMIIPANMCFGFWKDLLYKYKSGITIDIAQKTAYFINRSIEYANNYIPEQDRTTKLLEVRDRVKGWSEYNEYQDNMQFSGVVY